MRSTFAIVRTSPTVLPSPHLNNREFKIPRQRRPRKRRSKSKFAFLQCLSQLFQLIYFVKCKRTLFEPNCKETYPASERDRLFSRRLVMSFIKREIKHFSVAVVQWRQRNVQKRRDARAVVAFAFSPIAFLTFSLSSPSLWKQKLFSAGLSVRWRIVVFGRRSLWMPRPFQWSTDDDDEVYKVHEIQHYSRTSEMSDPRLLTYIVKR